MDRNSNGSYVIKDRIIDSYIVSEINNKEDNTKKNEEIKIVKKQISLMEIDDELSRVDSIINNIDA